MKTILSLANPAEVETECLVVLALDHASKNGSSRNGSKDKKDKPEVSLATNDAIIKDAVQDVIASGEVAGKLSEANLLHKPAKLKAKRLLVIGGGKAKTFSSVELRKVAGTAARFLKPRGIRSFAFLAPEGVLTDSDAVKSIIEGAFVGNFDPDTYKSDRKDQQIDALTVVARGDQARLQQALDEGRIIGESQNFTRELVNEPGNHMTPTILAERARKMAEEVGLKCEIFGGDKIKELKMGAFWSVAQGSDEPPALIILRYEPAGAPAKPVLGLVGKGVTFDTGGISIKPADGMEKMKYDMAGGAAMIGAMRGIALIKPKVKVTAIICATENMPSGKAQKPGDVQIAMSGKSIEIINTDAEGRLVLADGLFYARQLGCTHLIDAATLTGAVVVALGYVNAGVFANDDQMYERFTKALAKAGEKFWRMPLDEEYKESIRSGIADIVNSGGRWGGAITAAMFLKEFAEDTPWMHLDIAGTAWSEENKPWMAKGPSGIAVRSLVEFARDFGE
ncbi:MAG TPA: leucyl aminopeptidase [Terriglobales bacterium]|nr:leucyl aminopeptidase [Terriglobales bacterium]